MLANYRLEISGVDGSEHVLQSANPQNVYKFLINYDHEGASLHLEITDAAGENVYAILGALCRKKSK